MDTLREFRDQVGPLAPLVWLLGADAFRNLRRWQRWQELFTLAHLVVAARPGHALDELDPELQAAVQSRWISDPQALASAPSGLALKLYLKPRYEAASTVRDQIASHRHWEDETPPAVVAYIRKYGLYTA